MAHGGWQQAGRGLWWSWGGRVSCGEATPSLCNTVWVLISLKPGDHGAQALKVTMEISTFPDGPDFISNTQENPFCKYQFHPCHVPF